MLGKLLSIASVGSTLASVGVLHRFLSGIAVVLILAILSAFMLCVLLAGGLALTYFCLVHYGLDPYAAGITVGIVTLLITGALVILTAVQLRQLRELSGRIPHRHSVPDISHVAEAFIDGLLNPRR